MDFLCPECGQVLTRFKNKYLCKSCNSEYKMVKGKLKEVEGEY